MIFEANDALFVVVQIELLCGPSKNTRWNLETEWASLSQFLVVSLRCDYWENECRWLFQFLSLKVLVQLH